MTAKHHLDPAHTDDLAQIALDQMHHLSRNGVEHDRDLHRIPETPRAKLVSRKVTPRERNEDPWQQAGLGIGQQVEGNGAHHGYGFRK